MRGMRIAVVNEILASPAVLQQTSKKASTKKIGLFG
jgi:hypothetical protein